MNEFEKLVKEMRNCQKNYFRSKKIYWLRKSKELEAMVDNYLKNIESPKLNFDE